MKLDVLKKHHQKYNRIFNGQTIPFGTKYIFASSTNHEFKFGVEICEDLWLPDAPSIDLALNGATLILNPSASNEITTKKTIVVYW